MKIKKGFILRKVGNQFMAVAVGKAGKEFKGMIQINAAGEFLWNEMKKGISEDDLVQKMCDRYDGLDETTARADLKEFVESISVAIEL